METEAVSYLSLQCHWKKKQNKTEYSKAIVEFFSSLQIRDLT